MRRVTAVLVEVFAQGSTHGVSVLSVQALGVVGREPMFSGVFTPRCRVESAEDKLRLVWFGK